MSSQSVVLVSGASGYLGTEVVLSFLSAGYRVRGTVRTTAQRDAFIAKFPEHEANIEFHLVPSLVEKGAFDEAVKGVDYVAHTASPVPFGLITDPEHQLLIPAIEGTVGMLQSALLEPKIKAIVLTSSFASVRNFVDPAPNAHYTSDSWNPVTYEQAKAATPAQGLLAYSGSKVLAEKAAWDFMAREKPSFTLTTILPTWVLGPSQQPGVKSISDLQSSAGMTAKVLIDTPSLPPVSIFSKYVHIHDVALAHVGAIARPESRGKRYLLVAGPSSCEQAAFVLRKLFPAQAGRIAPAEDKPLEVIDTADGTPAEQAFGFKYRTFEETMQDYGEQLFSLAK
ncbi:hypothetical protein P7C70_g2296, partial [Phenoliferia sp. Uapishka_3]